MTESTRKIKIMHILQRLEVGGKENGIVNICNNFDRERFSSSICCLKGIGRMKTRLKPDVEVFNLNLGEGKPLLRPLVLAKFFRIMQPDIVHTHAWGGGFYSGIIGAKLARVPVAINGEHGGFGTKLYQLYAQRFLARLCNQVLSVSESLKKTIVTEVGIPSSKIHVVANGVDTARFTGDHNTAKLKEELRNNFQLIIGQNDFVVGCVGSLKRGKNQILLLRALKEIRDRDTRNRIKVLFIGDGPDRAMLETYAKNAGLSKQVFFLGIRKDVTQLLCLTDISASVSLPQFEGLSNVVLEAMASRVAVISTKSVGSTELISDGVNGFLVDVDDVKALAQKLESLASNPEVAKEAGQRAREFVTANFSLQKMVSDYEEIYTKTVKDAGIKL